MKVKRSVDKDFGWEPTIKPGVFHGKIPIFFRETPAVKDSKSSKSKKKAPIP